MPQIDFFGGGCSRTGCDEHLLFVVITVAIFGAGVGLQLFGAIARFASLVV
jgi:hypothetical protein